MCIRDRLHIYRFSFYFLQATNNIRVMGLAQRLIGYDAYEKILDLGGKSLERDTLRGGGLGERGERQRKQGIQTCV